jgi:large subunit ribosomal protein L35
LAQPALYNPPSLDRGASTATAGHAQTVLIDNLISKEHEMPKMKTKSGAKKRFKLTGSGKVKMFPSQRRHRQISRPKKMKRHARGPEVMNESDAKVVKKYFLPNG